MFALNVYFFVGVFHFMLFHLLDQVMFAWSKAEFSAEQARLEKIVVDSDWVLRYVPEKATLYNKPNLVIVAEDPALTLVEFVGEMWVYGGVYIVGAYMLF